MSTHAMTMATTAPSGDTHIRRRCLMVLAVMNYELDFFAEMMATRQVPDWLIEIGH
jgi:hypothetical protein